MNRKKVKFGETSKEQDELAGLVEQGVKVATSSLKFFQDEGLSVPTSIGDKWAIENSLGELICLVEVTAVCYQTFSKIDETFAIAEGDGSFDRWYSIHSVYYSHLLNKYKQELTDQTILECVYFKKSEEQ
ncbi:hypothetical protein RV11_GL002834 [Enterococcus phoeniculicola]|jgi:uncharacterized protein YhfF|uniref:ASCH domain-containing protein n=1 Tax=Enterococcus phoeniculicola ATCC BAA-412 TaxID=1158610 RepID=R3TKP9_9ENTE|nr:ASCH domain-containing protein [Enterococcus phoeniculicola]EOL41643.1 hypothetical protein UC3_03208 [Enterococcus phoeniculicola ATCC BAA-412]EOT78863.1 hypothetical protein I589_00368 [Enterococcus phoeniculicola ATCC BAA-412]OJG72695.1 hypothetical protein RV11_GL002834 [Enterococcus phoeniculicola]